MQGRAGNPQSTSRAPGETRTAFGTVIVEPEERKRSAGAPSEGQPAPERLLAGASVLIFLVLCVVQIANWPTLFDPDQVLTAGRAVPLVVVYGLAVVGLIGAAATIPERLLHLPIAVAGGFLTLVLATTLVNGGEAWPFATALLTMSACWISGRWLLAAIKSPELAASPPVAWLAGTAGLGLVLMLLGRAGLLRWWTAGVLVLALGFVGLLQVSRQAKPLARAGWKAVTGSRLAAGCAALILLLLGFAAIWAAAPELQFDALYSKAWLPAEWARIGEITPLRDHVILNLYGFGQILAIPGHLVGAGDVGRYLQYLSVAAVPASIWWILRSRTEWAPLAAAIVAVTPMLFWEATTAYDDALLVLAALAITAAVVSLVELPASKTPFWEGAAVGVLAGACVDLKLHLVWLVGGLLIAYLLLRPRLRALAGLVAAGVLTACPPVIARWSDIGDPFYPALLGVFHSPYLAPDGPIATRAGEGGGQTFDSPIQAFWHSFVRTDSLFSGWPTGTFGVITLALLAAVVAALVHRRGATRGLIAISIALVLAAIGWYFQLKGPRYLLPTGIVAVLALGLLSQGHRIARRRELAALIALCIVAILLWPSTVAQFWNVPDKDVPLSAALGLRDAAAYEQQSQTERAALSAFNSLSAPGSTAISFPSQRAWISGGRDLKMTWELHDRLLLDGGLPGSPEEALRRIRDQGADWMLMQTTAQRLPGFYYLYGTIERYGQLRWADERWALFELRNRPAPPTPYPSCDEALTGAPGCWLGRFDGRPGYSSKDPSGLIHRAVPACPGELVTLDVRTSGQGLVPIWIDFNGSDPSRGHVRPFVAGDTTARIGGSAPPGATRATVSIPKPPAGIAVRSAKLGHYGRCSPDAH